MCIYLKELALSGKFSFSAKDQEGRLKLLSRNDPIQSLMNHNAVHGHKLTGMYLPSLSKNIRLHSFSIAERLNKGSSISNIKQLKSVTKIK